ncbi:MAG: twin-arginine translocase subunit TatB [Phenylobacterium zucineum]|nr:MAG: twin-arginine translocase subunit TatB [Phenylobacterium zucineum]
MLPDVGGLEYLVIAVVALLVVGPKDLPKMLRVIGQFVGKLRGMAAEFRASFDEMARQSELDELRAEVEAMRKGQIFDQPHMDSTGDVSRIFDEIGDSLQSGGLQLHPPMSHQIEAAAEPMTIEAASAPAKPARKRKSPTTKTATETPRKARAIRKPKPEILS